MAQLVFSCEVPPKMLYCWIIHRQLSCQSLRLYHLISTINFTCLVVWNIFYFFRIIGNNTLNWLIFFKGVETTNQLTQFTNIIINYGSIMLYHAKADLSDLRKRLEAEQSSRSAALGPWGSPMVTMCSIYNMYGAYIYTYVSIHTIGYPMYMSHTRRTIGIQVYINICYIYTYISIHTIGYPMYMSHTRRTIGIQVYTNIWYIHIYIYYVYTYMCTRRNVPYLLFFFGFQGSLRTLLKRCLKLRCAAVPCSELRCREHIF